MKQNKNCPSVDTKFISFIFTYVGTRPKVGINLMFCFVRYNARSMEHFERIKLTSNWLFILETVTPDRSPRLKGGNRWRLWTQNLIPRLRVGFIAGLPKKEMPTEIIYFCQHTRRFALFGAPYIKPRLCHIPLS